MHKFYVAMFYSQKSDDSDLKDDKSWYEKRREENLRANAAFLAQLNISEVGNQYLGRLDSMVLRFIFC